MTALCTFAVGLAAVAASTYDGPPVVQKLGDPPCLLPPVYESLSGPCSGADFSALGDVPDPGYCELMGSPELYDGRVVRVRARLVMGIHGLTFYDGGCPASHEQVAVLYHPTARARVERALEDAQGPDGRRGPLDLTAVGRFRTVTPSYASDAYEDTARLRFEMMWVEAASRSRRLVN